MTLQLSPPPAIANPYLDLFQAAFPGGTASFTAYYSQATSPPLAHLAPLLHPDARGALDDYERRRTSFTDGAASFYVRDLLVRAYAWAIPNTEALAAITSLDCPIVEIGAGSGYWAGLLRQLGVTVHAYDIEPWHHQHTAVTPGGTEMAALHPDAALMLCWPPYAEPMAHDALQAFVGDRLIYVGEGSGGCTGDDAFHERLAESWTELIEVDLPQWRGIHDRLTIYQRN